MINVTIEKLHSFNVGKNETKIDHFSKETSGLSGITGNKRIREWRVIVNSFIAAL